MNSKPIDFKLLYLISKAYEISGAIINKDKIIF